MQQQTRGKNHGFLQTLDTVGVCLHARAPCGVGGAFSYPEPLVWYDYYQSLVCSSKLGRGLEFGNSTAWCVAHQVLVIAPPFIGCDCAILEYTSVCHQHISVMLMALARCVNFTVRLWCTSCCSQALVCRVTLIIPQLLSYMSSSMDSRAYSVQIVFMSNVCSIHSRHLESKKAPHCCGAFSKNVSSARKVTPVPPPPPAARIPRTT